MAFGRRKKEKPKFARNLRKEDEDFDDEDDELEDDAEDESKSRKKTFKSKDFKDLNPKDKKARKEPAKPWGKKERLLVLFVILATAGISAYLSLTSTGWKLSDLFNINKPNFSFGNLFKEELIVIPGDAYKK